MDFFRSNSITFCFLFLTKGSWSWFEKVARAVAEGAPLNVTVTLPSKSKPAHTPGFSESPAASLIETQRKKPYICYCVLRILFTISYNLKQYSEHMLSTNYTIHSFIHSYLKLNSRQRGKHSSFLAQEE